MPRETTTEILKRIELKLDQERFCIATEKEYEDHCKVIEEIKVLMPQFKIALQEYKKALEQGAKTFIAHNDRLLILETQKKMTVWIVAGVSGLLSSVISGALLLAITHLWNNKF